MLKNVFLHVMGIFWKLPMMKAVDRSKLIWKKCSHLPLSAITRKREITTSSVCQIELKGLKRKERMKEGMAPVLKKANEDCRCSCHRAHIHVCLCFRFKDTIVNAKYGGHTEAVRRLLGQLPISAQSYSSSPYLDLSLFSYDDKWVSVMERPKTCGDHPIRYRLCHSERANDWNRIT